MTALSVSSITVASPAVAPTRVLASIHDVTPAHETAVHTLWEACRQEGITPALLVVPNWHGQWPLSKATRFVRWVQHCAAHGADLFLHGERHDEVGLPRNVRDQLRAVGRTAGEGEFLTLDRVHARERIERGLAVLRELDLSPIGFVPPAWLARPSTHEVVRESGLALSEDVGRVFVHAGLETSVVPSPVLRWSARTTVRAHASRLVAAWRWHRHRHAAMIRLALHPQDLDHPIAARSARGAIAAWGAHGLVSSYREMTR